MEKQLPVNKPKMIFLKSNLGLGYAGSGGTNYKRERGLKAPVRFFPAFQNHITVQDSIIFGNRITSTVLDYLKKWQLL